MKRTIILLLGLLTAMTALSESYTIKVHAPQLANRDVYLAGYFNGKIYSRDTTHLNGNGYGYFSKSKKLEEGLYMLYVNPNSRYYDFLVAEGQKLDLTVTDTTQNIVKCFSVTGDEQSEKFIEMGRYITSQREKSIELNEKIKQGKEKNQPTEKYETQLQAIDKEVIDYQRRTAEQYKGRTLGIFVSALLNPRFPEALVQADLKDEKVQYARYAYAKDHYFDNYNLSDVRSWRINQLNQRLEDYLEHHVIQLPDSIIPEVMNLIEKSKGDTVCFNLMTNYMIDYSVRSRIMGMDKLFARIVEKYYFTGQAYWADSALMSTIRSEYAKVRLNQLGMKAGNLPLRKFDGTRFHIYDVNKAYTLVYFFEPSCGHCKEVTPKVHEVYEKYKDKGFEVVAIYLLQDKEEWREFIEKNNLHDWINAWDPERESYYWEFYDTSTTPGVYLIDKDKKIVAKKISAESLDDILKYELIEKKENGKAPRRDPKSTKTADYDMGIDLP
ncbi:MAG: redoxin domain-containing protein [Paludibacteraceae bacterium]|nr:redoxin domain-containing protein [Paludibacteraceae bacterium]